MLFTGTGGKFKFSAQDSDLAHFLGQHQTFCQKANLRGRTGSLLIRFIWLSQDFTFDIISISGSQSLTAAVARGESSACSGWYEIDEWGSRSSFFSVPFLAD